MTIRWNGDAVMRELRARSLVAVRQAADHLLEVSNERVPDDPTNPTGSDLKQSGKVTAELTHRGAEAAVSYDTEYAVLQHEVLYYDHRPGQQAKFLESAMSGEVPAIRAILRRGMRI